MIIILLFPTLFNTMLPIFRLEVTLTSVYMTRKVFYFHWNFILKVIKRRILFILKGNLGYHFMFTTNMMKYRRTARNSRAVDVVRESIFWYNVKQFAEGNCVLYMWLIFINGDEAIFFLKINSKWPTQKKTKRFLKPPILNIFSQKFHGLDLWLVRLIDAKGIGVAQPIWSWGCPT